MSSVKKFGFFLNTALNRAIYRLFEKQYKKYFPVIDNNDDNSHLLLNAGYRQHIDFSEVDLMGFSETELAILKFKIEGGKLNVFLKEHELPRVKFDKTLEEVKEKLLVLYSNDEYFLHHETVIV